MIERLTLESLKSLADQVLPAVFGDKIVAKINKQDENDEAPCLDIGAPDQDAMIQVFCEHEKFLVTYGVVITGCRTMPNGDPGYPDDYDVIEADMFGKEKKAIQLLVSRLPSIFNVRGCERDDVEKRASDLGEEIFGNGMCPNEGNAISLVVQLLIGWTLDTTIENWDWDRIHEEEKDFAPQNPAGSDTEM